MDDLFGDDAWGEEPDWAKNNVDAGKESSNGNVDESDGDTVPVMLGAQHVILLVDCHSDMFRPMELENDHHTRRPVDLAMILAKQLLAQRIRDTVTLKIGKRNGVGLLLYDTKPLSLKVPDSFGEERNEDDGLNDNDDDDEEEEGDEDDDDDDQGGNATTQVHVLLNLNPPGISEVQSVRSCLKGHRNLEDEFSNKTHSSDLSPRIAPLQIAIEEAVRIFRKARCVREKASKPNEPLDTRSIWILTNRDQPYPPETQQLLQNVAQDAQESGVQIIVWPLPHPDKTEDAFAMEHMYESVVSQDVFNGRRFRTEDELEEGLDDLQQYWKMVRRLYLGPMLLPGVEQRQNEPLNDNGDDKSENAQIMVDWFRFVQLAKKPNKVQIDQRTKRETIKLKQMLDNNHEIFATFKPGDADDRKKPKGGMKRIRQFAPFGNENVPMSNDDINQIRLAANGGKTKPGLSILGFKPKDSIPWYHTMSSAYFIYPNDDVVKGSKDAFIELQAAMVRKQVLAIGEVLHRVHWSSRLVAIYPMEERGFSSEQRSPSGMMVVTLPFEDDIRTLEEDEAWQAWVQQSSNDERVKQEAPDEMPSVDLKSPAAKPFPPDDLIKSAANLISRQRLEGMELGEDFVNAPLTDFFNYLEAVALEIPVPQEDEEFDTRPDDNMILEAVKDQIEEFRQSLPDDIEIPKASSGGAQKRKKDLPPDDSGLDWNDLYLSDELNQVKVPQLKSYLRSVGAPVSGNKSVLVERATEWIKKSLSGPRKGDIKTEET